jgi:hypothetical protein
MALWGLQDDGAQGLTYTRQVLHRFSHAPSPFVFEIGSHTFAQAGLELELLLLSTWD